MSWEPSLDEILEALEKISGKTTDQEIARAVTILADPQKTKMFSDLTRQEVYDFADLLQIAEDFNLSWLRGQINKILILKVSQGRKGRDELVKVISRAEEKIREEVRRILKPFRGLRRSEER